MKKIPVKGSDRPMLVDDEDFEYISKFNWSLHRLGYVWCHLPARIAVELGMPRKMYYAHRVIAKTPEGMTTDHINLDKMDNRKSNLRICTHRQNTFNRPKRKDAITSKYVGVSWNTKLGCFLASIIVDGKRKHIRCQSEQEAALRYNEYAKSAFGEFARLNQV